MSYYRYHVFFCTNLGWENIPLREELRKHIDKPIFIDNDATVAALAPDGDGGELVIDWDEATDHVLMTGPVEIERTGVLSI